MAASITADTTEIVSLAEVKDHLNIPASNTSHDAELALFREAAQEAVEHLIGPVLWRVVTETTRPTIDGDVLLRTFPVVSVDDVTHSAGVTVDGWTLDASLGTVTGLRTGAELTVTYTAGRTSLPSSVKLATLIIAGHLWTTQRGPSSSPTALQDGDAGEPVPGLGYSIPNRAVDLLRPFLLPPAVA